MEIPSGSTLLPVRNRIDNHLWVVLTEPDGNPLRVVMVNLTSWRPGVDTTVVLNQPDHPIVSRRTVINYGAARLAYLESIQEAIKGNALRIMQPVSSELLRRIRIGLMESAETPEELKSHCRRFDYWPVPVDQGCRS